jgi:ribosomal protein L37E
MRKPPAANWWLLIFCSLPGEPADFFTRMVRLSAAHVKPEAIMVESELTPEQLKRVSERLDELWGEDSKCERCGTSSWDIESRLFEIVQFSRSILKQAMLPCFAVTCNRCGNTRLVNAITIGLLDEHTGGWKNG